MSNLKEFLKTLDYPSLYEYKRKTIEDLQDIDLEIEKRDKEDLKLMEQKGKGS